MSFPTLERLRARLTDELDQRLLFLMSEGERSTDEFAVVLGIQHLDQHEKERIVKRNKDRLKKKLQRYLERHDQRWLESVLIPTRQGKQKHDDE